MLAREITPLVRCIVCIRCCSPFFFFLFFFATLRKLTWSRLPSATVYHRRSVWLRCLPPFCASPSIWNFGCLSRLFRDNVSTETHPIHHHNVEFGAKTTVKGASCCVWRLMMGRQLDSGSGSLGVSLSPQSALTPAADPQPPTPPPRRYQTTLSHVK